MGTLRSRFHALFRTSTLPVPCSVFPAGKSTPRLITLISHSLIIHSPISHSLISQSLKIGIFSFPARDVQIA